MKKAMQSIRQEETTNKLSNIFIDSLM